ncbi:mycofactocin-coupled SDR family oxidoreductase [Pseudofrankia asymbiotica]|uniref:3-ketoacyl-ACP reductase n=1 Tax=Pseudofrankia asymbiotica TaxID=1834516 RepID=A0A1V2I7P6_9ACTN|nr:mycofactocin-coupled SDR family oxidoreductase [Pseudofrankia asymbiotica]ONH28016.1 3-ketoacyl-ACP reductase [Pseudofrankia asymbiotica]
MAGRVDGKVALVTGAARGMGRSHALRLALEGADVILVDICDQIETNPVEMPTRTDLDETVRLVKATGRQVTALEIDVRDLEALTAGVDEAVAAMGRLDIVCANAGIGGFETVREMTARSWQDMIDVNLTGVWNTTKATLAHLADSGRGGAMVLTSSTAGFKAGSQAVHYAAAKHGVIGLVKTLANELGPFSVRVNAVCPAMTATPMILNDGVFRLFRPDLEAPTVDDARAGFASHHALPIPWVEPVDVSNAVLFLASDDARYITGIALPVDAGYLVK